MGRSTNGSILARILVPPNVVDHTWVRRLGHDLVQVQELDAKLEPPRAATHAPKDASKRVHGPLQERVEP